MIEKFGLMVKRIKDVTNHASKRCAKTLASFLDRQFKVNSSKN